VCIRGGGLLLIRRSQPPHPGRWSLPGGRVAPGESLEQAVARELFEETGLVGEAAGLCGIAERIGDDHHYVILDYFASVGLGEPLAGDDAEAVCFANRGELDRLSLVPGLWGFLADHGVLDRLE
jgi:acetyl-CoA carboxylase carboxyl transferase subunit beta